MGMSCLLDTHILLWWLFVDNDYRDQLIGENQNGV